MENNWILFIFLLKSLKFPDLFVLLSVITHFIELGLALFQLIKFGGNPIFFEQFAERVKANADPEIGFDYSRDSKGITHLYWVC